MPWLWVSAAREIVADEECFNGSTVRCRGYGRDNADGPAKCARATMGPRSDAVVMEERILVEHRVHRCFNGSTVRCRGYGREGQPAEVRKRASMGPRSDAVVMGSRSSSGASFHNSLQWVHGPMPWLWTSRCRSRRTTRKLQWVHGPMPWLWAQLADAIRFHTDASMGPRSDAVVMAPTCASHLLRRRASMGPRSDAV